MIGWMAAALGAASLAGVPVAVQPAAVVCGTAPATDRLAEPWWTTRHAALLAQIAADADPEVVLIGDSITQNYDKSKLPDENFRPTWDRFYAPRHALNLGFSGDTTANLLWRLRNGEVNGIAPKVAVLLIGTNDTAKGVSTDATVCGIDAAITEIQRRLPKTRILLLGVLPSDISPEKSAADAAVNAALAARYRHDRRVMYRNVGAVFRRGDGTLDTTIFYDPRLTDRHARALHPDTRGQARMAEAIEPTLAGMLKDEPPAPRR
jgi:lysophospholipase L1-like esterase